MSKFNPNSLISNSCLMSLIALCYLSTPAKSAPANIKLTTEPALETIVPYEAEAESPQKAVKLTLQATDDTGKPLTNVRMQVKLLTPPPTPWFTTDFPIVEGTQLLNITADAPTGELKLEQMFPIRGKYQLQVTATPLDANQGEATIQQNITLTVPENSIKYQNFAKLALLLTAIGLGGGWVIAAKRPTREGEIAPQAVRLLLSGASLAAIAAMLYVNVSAEMAQSGVSESLAHSGANHEHGTHEHSHPAVPSSNTTLAGIRLSITGDKSATVGKPANFQVTAVDVNTNQPVNGTVKIKTINTEKSDKWIASGYQGAISNGKLAWQSGLFDGSGHRINVEFTPIIPNQNSVVINASQPVEVEGVAPPLFVRIISLGYMTGIAGSAFLLAFYLRRQIDQKASMA